MIKNETGSRRRALTVTLSVVLAVLVLAAAFCAAAYSNNLFGLRDIIAESSNSSETAVNAWGNMPDISDIPGRGLHSVYGAWLRPGTDYLTDPAAPYGTQAELVTSYLDSMRDYGLNALTVPVNFGEKAIYSTSVCENYYGGEGENLLSFILSEAKNRGIEVYALVSLNTLCGGLDVYSAADAEKMQQAVRDLCAYDINGLILADYGYGGDADGAYADYLANGGGCGFEEYKRAQLDNLIKTTVKTARSSRSGLYLGLCADAVWAKASSAEGGLDTDGAVAEDYIDKSADTLGWLKSGMFNFALINDGLSTKSSPSFNSVAEWWVNSLSDVNTDVYISHAAYKLGTDEDGWKSHDQLAEQLMALGGMDVCGSFFDSVSSLTNDTTGSTNVICGYMKGTVSSDSIANRLAVTSPGRTDFTTYENMINIIGSSDPNFPLKLNGQDVERTENGYFSFDYELASGTNSLIFEHKGESVTYNITYKIVVIRDVSPSTDQSFDGGSVISFGVSALDGSSVTAAFNGQTVKLQKQQQQTEEGSHGDDSSYTVYVGQVTLPESRESAQDLGNVIFKASYKGMTDKTTGGRITVNPIPQSTGTWPGKPSYVTVGNQYIAEVVTDQAETFNGSSIDDYSRADNFPLPKGTLDYCGANDIVFMAPGSDTQYYRLMRFGKRVYRKSKNQGEVVKVYQGTLPETNTVTAASVDVRERKTALTLDVGWKAPFDIALSPQGYSNPNNTSGRPAFDIGSATYEYVDITFHYAATAQGAVNMTGSRVFSRAEWIKGDGCYVLRLYLKRTGGFYGYSAEYNDNGQLVFEFLHPAKVNTAGGAGSLSGVNIVIDAGHGGKDPGAAGSLSGWHEAQLNLIMAQKIESKLKDLGANVYMTRTGDNYMSLEQRAAFTRAAEPDLFVSVHRNSSTSSSAKGYEDYYFYPFSMPLAKSVYDSVASTGHLSMRGMHYYPYYVTRVTDCPSILTENGFMSNASEYQRLISDDSNERLAQATVDGIVRYLNSIQ